VLRSAQADTSPKGSVSSTVLFPEMKMKLTNLQLTSQKQSPYKVN